MVTASRELSPLKQLEYPYLEMGAQTLAPKDIPKLEQLADDFDRATTDGTIDFPTGKLYLGWLTAELGNIAERSGDEHAAITHLIRAQEHMKDSFINRPLEETLNLMRTQQPLHLLRLRTAMLQSRIDGQPLPNVRPAQVFLTRLGLYALNEATPSRNKSRRMRELITGEFTELMFASFILDITNRESSKLNLLPVPTSPREDRPRRADRRRPKVSRDFIVTRYDQEPQTRDRIAVQVKTDAPVGNYDEDVVKLVDGKLHMNMGTRDQKKNLAKTLLIPPEERNSRQKETIAVVQYIILRKLDLQHIKLGAGGGT